MDFKYILGRVKTMHNFVNIRSVDMILKVGGRGELKYNEICVHAKLNSTTVIVYHKFQNPQSPPPHPPPTTTTSVYTLGHDVIKV